MQKTLPFALLFVAGCSSETSSMAYQYVPSTGVATRDLRGSFTVSGEQGTETVRAGAFFSNARTDDGVNLTGGDEVFCEGVRLDSSFGASYGDLPRKAPGERYTFELRRAGETITVAVTALEALAMTAPASKAEAKLNEPLTVSWKPAVGTSIDAQLMGGCVVSTAKSDVEAGSLVLDVTRLPSVPDKGTGPSTPGYNPQNPDGTKSCVGDATLSLVRARKANVETTLAVTATLSEESHRIPVHVAE